MKHEDSSAGREEIGGDGERKGGGMFVCWLLNVLATCWCISGTDLLRLFFVLPL